ncbi:hypothetical protein DPMN_103888 [Dreissena polymorpha]|uniref:Uncharacterized protein n=1 Tax=Dreissena polymorpha TaxID=45954 RepID=A0A9D4K2T6_DREPO|nr:hypothetical protein DPMN_103888 [Dreissena polymorpha]
MCRYCRRFVGAGISRRKNTGCRSICCWVGDDSYLGAWSALHCPSKLRIVCNFRCGRTNFSIAAS